MWEKLRNFLNFNKQSSTSVSTSTTFKSKDTNPIPVYTRDKKE